SPLFGREEELGQLLEAWSLAREGEGQLVLVQGEAGIGKSLLIETFRQRISGEPNAQVTWYCSPNFTKSALQPVFEQLTRMADLVRGDSDDIRRSKFLALLDRFGATARDSQAVLLDLVGIPPDPE